MIERWGRGGAALKAASVCGGLGLVYKSYKGGVSKWDGELVRSPHAGAR